MPRTIHADLLTEQKKPAYIPAFQITLSDNNLPHPNLIKTPLANASANPTASTFTGSAIIRAQRVAGVGIRIQRITNPSVTSQWETWTTVETNANASYPALFTTGTRVVLVYQDTSTQAVLFRTSDNDGQSWSSPTTIFTATYLLNHTQCGISGPSNRCGIIYANTTTLYYRAYNPATNTFTAEFSTTFTGTVTSTAAVHIAGDTFMIALHITDYASWTDSAIILQPLTFNGSSATWGTPTTYIGIQGGTGAQPAYAFGHVFLNKIGTWYWLTYTYAASQAAGATFSENDTIIATSDDATFFTAGLRISQSIADRLQAHRWTDGTVYLCSDRHLLSSQQVATVTAPTHHLKALDIQDYGPTAYAEIVLDNRTGTYTNLATGRLGCDVTIHRGALCDGTPRTVARERFAAARFTLSADGTTMTIRAYNYYRLLELWRAPFPYYYTHITLGKLVEAIAALAGIHSVSLESSNLWNITLGEFAITPGQSAAEALASLQDQFQFLTRMGEGTTLQALILSSNPSPTYIFGPEPTAHPTLRAEDSVERVAPDITHAEVIGSNAGASAIATTLQFEMGRQFTHRITREVLTSNSDCQTVANTIVTKLTNSVNRSEILCLPAFHLQPFDPVRAPDGTTRYIATIRETYNPASLEHLPRRIKQVYRQRITLAAIAPSAGARSSLNTIVPEIWRRSEFRKGKLVSFDPTTWKALVWLDDSAGAVLLPVARHLHPATLVANRRVAVIQFDTTNPSDGLVVGVYSGTNYWQPFDRLYAADGDPAPAVQTNADGRLRALYGLDVTGTLTTSSTATLSGFTSSGPGVITNYLELSEISAPAATTDRARLYARDDNGRTNLYARMSDQIRPVSFGQACRAYHNANISISHATATVIPLNSERYDTDNIHDTTTNTSRLTCQTPGLYLITACVRFAANTTGDRQIYIRHSTGSIIAAQTVRACASSSRPTDLCIATIWQMSADQYVELFAWQDSGAALNVLYAAGISPEFAMIRIG